MEPWVDDTDPLPTRLLPIYWAAPSGISRRTADLAPAGVRHGSLRLEALWQVPKTDVERLRMDPEPPVTAPAPLRLPRHLFHLVAGSALPLAALLFPRSVVLTLAGATTALFATGDALRLASPAVNRWFLSSFHGLLKPGERRRVTGATYLAAASLATLILFEPPVAALALFFVAFGDPAAALVGSRYGRFRLSMPGPWALKGQQAKSLEGALAFLAVALAVAALLRGAGVYGLYWPAAVGALVAAFVELLPFPIDDNVSVPLASATVMALIGMG